MLSAMAPLPISGEADNDEMCWPIEWFREDLPLENDEGTSLDQQMQDWFNDACTLPKHFENFSAYPNRKPPLSDLVTGSEAPPPESVLVFMDSNGFAEKILDAVPKKRMVMMHSVAQCGSLTQEDVRGFIEKQQYGYDLIIFAYGLESPKSNDVVSISEQQHLSAKLYLWVLQEVQKFAIASTKIAVLTRGVFAEDRGTHKKAGLKIISGAHLFGMTNTARLELDNPIQYIDTDWSLSPEEAGDPQYLPRVAAELFRPQTFGHSAVRVLKHGRYVMRRVNSLRYEYIKPHANHQREVWKMEPPTTGTIAISGGNGALGLVTAFWLLGKIEDSKGQVKDLQISLLSRSAEIPDANLPEWTKLLAKAKRLGGIRIEKVTCDVTSSTAVDSFVEGLGGQLSGFVHAAAVAQDSMLNNLTLDNLEEVWAPKHVAALYFHRALEHHHNPNLKIFWLYSCNSVYGSMGEIHYSGTNAILDALSRHRTACGQPTVAIQWGLWKDVGGAANLSEAMKKRAEQGPEPSFSNTEGFKGLEAGLRTGLPVFSVTKLNKTIIENMHASFNTPLQCYQRNFNSEVVRFPPNLDVEREHAYTVWAEGQRGSYRHDPGKHQLVYDTYTKALAKEEEDTWGDDFRKWSK